MFPEIGQRLLPSENKATFDKEQSVWEQRGAYERVEKLQVPEGANIVGSHTIYLRKDNGTVKDRIVPWGHRDQVRHDLRSDLSCLNREIFRLILSIAAEKKWKMAQMDAEKAYLQANGFSWEIYIRPPKEANDPMALWRLLVPAYGLVDSGRLWYRTNDAALLKVCGCPL